MAKKQIENSTYIDMCMYYTYKTTGNYFFTEKRLLSFTKGYQTLFHKMNQNQELEPVELKKLEGIRTYMVKGKEVFNPSEEVISRMKNTISNLTDIEKEPLEILVQTKLNAGKEFVK